MDIERTINVSRIKIAGSKTENILAQKCEVLLRN